MLWKWTNETTKPIDGSEHPRDREACNPLRDEACRRQGHPSGLARPWNDSRTP